MGFTEFKILQQLNLTATKSARSSYFKLQTDCCARDLENAYQLWAGNLIVQELNSNFQQLEVIISLL